MSEPASTGSGAGDEAWEAKLCRILAAQQRPVVPREYSDVKHEHAFVDRPDGSRIAWRTSGRSDAPAVIFSNSLGANWTMWDEVVAALSDEALILTYDTRGHGRSAAGSASATLEDLAGDLLAVMDAAGQARCDMVGLSLGGMTGLHTALRHPGRIRRLVACNCRAAVDAAGFQAWEERIAALRAGGLPSLVGPTIDRWFSAAFQSAQPAMMQRVAAMIANNSPRGYEACVRAIQGLDLERELPGLRMPVLYVAGAQDIGAPAAEMERMAALTPGARYALLDPCGHIACMERSADLIALLRGFLGGAETDAP